MSKNKNRSKKQPAADVAPPKDKKKSRPLMSFYGFRELVESVAIAFILAFLFRTFEAEAFVIPTGSMATTLMGRHKDLACDKCGYQFQVSASEEIDSKSGNPTGKVVMGGVCPMCRHPMALSPRSLKEKDHRSFNGDRIIVGKFMYQFEDPSRWDVSVFKFPANSQTNFIKRLVGLPNETVRISRGDLFTKPTGDENFSIARKPPNKQLAMLQMVYDNDYVLPGMLEKGWPARWQGQAGQAGGWKSSSDHRAFSISGGQEGRAWLQYVHFVPKPWDWHELSKGPLPEDHVVKPQLIADFISYNTGIWGNPKTGKASNGLRGYGTHWVGDLAVEYEIEVESSSGDVLLKLVEGGRDMLCDIDVSTGKATLTISGESFTRTGQTPVSKPGTYKVMFSNIDDQLRLWVDGDLVAFDKPTTYGPLNNGRPQKEDLAPVGIGSQGVKMRVSHLKVFRDIYYIADKSGNGGVSDFDSPHEVYGGHTLHDLSELFSNPNRWDVFDSDKMGSVEFPLGEDQFLMLGDNSAMSRDSRLWNPHCEHYVDRDLMIGKALYIYWPHSWDKLPGTDIPFPFFPNVKEMQFVR